MDLLLLTHIIFMAIACILVITAAIMAKKRGKLWLKHHKRLAIMGIFSSIMGAAGIVFLKISHHYSHFQSPHAIFGLVTLCLLVITLILGVSIVKGPKPIREVHKIFGRITSISIILTVIMGVMRLLSSNV